MRKLALIVLLHLVSNALGQSISGVIKDADTKKPIAFANLKIPHSRQGTSTDIDGRFTLKMPTDYAGNIIISHVSYQRRKININEFKLSKNEILLYAKTTNLKELVFLADENPAHAIVRKAVANRKINNPNKLSSYQHKTYSKQIFTLEGEDGKADSLLHALAQNDTLQLTKKDSSILKLDAFLKQQHLFITESVTEKKYLNPGLINEKLLAIKTSGAKSPLFATTGTQYQPMGFYDEVINILERPYINPISSGSLRRFDFHIEDTTHYQMDTVFILSFEPKKGKKFEGLKGHISISKNGYAIRNVIARTADPITKTDVSIQQSYDCFDGIWFPTQLNTDVTFKEFDLNGRKMVVEAKSFFSEIELNKKLYKNEFSDVALELAPIDDQTSTTILSNTRNRMLDSLEQNTYVVLDSMMGNKLDILSNIFEYVFTQRIPIGKLDFRIDKFAKFNKYEKIRLGAGLYTNQSFSKSIQLGAYAGYGFNDEAWKYGGSIQLQLDKRTSTSIEISYSNDLEERGMKTNFNIKKSYGDITRSMVGSEYHINKKYGFSLQSRIAPFMYGQLSLNKTHSIPTYDYSYSNAVGLPISTFDFTEVSISTRYARKESYLNLSGKKVFLERSYPIIEVNYTRGISGLLEGEFEYNRFDFSIDFKKKTRFGSTSIYLKTGFIDKDIPLTGLMTGRGNGSSSLLNPHYFQTMALYEFVSDKETMLFFSHNFGNILLNTKFIKPELVLYQNLGIGSLSNSESHQNSVFNTLEKGYFEPGIGLKNLVRLNYANIGYVGLGIGAFYRAGAYAFTKTSDNFALRFNFDFTF